MKSSGILVRTDSSAALGTGHSMRCLALAQLCRELDVPVALAHAETTPSQQRRWLSEASSSVSISVLPGSREDADTTARVARELDCEWVVIDGYHFGTAYQRQLKTHGCRVLCIDDGIHIEHSYADVVLNQNAYGRADHYAARESFTRLLIGSRYALLRREFRRRAHRRERSIPRTASRLLVTLGGADPHNATDAVLASLRLIDAVPLTVRIVIGGSHPSAGSITNPLTPRDSIEIIHDAADLAELMSWGDMAISGAGTTSWELAFMGTPALALVIADNQVLVGESLEAHEVAINLGRVGSMPKEELARMVARLAADYETRLRMSQAGQRLIDGHGACRVLQALGLALLRLERASPRDSTMLWEWANEPAVRRFSFNSDPIAWETHEQWFAQKLSDPNSSILIAYDADDQPVGQIRFDCREGDVLQVSASVPSGRRGRGYGRELIAEGLRQVSAMFPGRQAHALIKRDNVASLCAFRSAGFAMAGEVIVGGHKAVHYVWQPASR